MGTLTVRENLEFSAALRLPLSMSEKEKQERVEQIIRELDLSKVADSKVCARDNVKYCQTSVFNDKAPIANPCEWPLQCPAFCPEWHLECLLMQRLERLSPNGQIFIWPFFALLNGHRNSLE